ILHFPKRLKEEGLATDDDIQRMEQEVEKVVDEAVRFADESPEPAPEELYADILAEQG
ncbi:MAG: pyruvate dehydrogenase (acetyl-transferring) E1 component subunit alpha, partial [Chloroflexi bacterium]|nr:pyruvate dehydrogenase (acetyl-transferring) E1 component subunit alpha [Chloroflexota bacterium]